RAIKAVRADIKANLLALKLFKDSPAVAFRVQGQVLLGASRLSLLALVPMAIMLVPVSLILGQLALWYEAKPLSVDEETVVTLVLNRDPQPSDTLIVPAGVEVTLDGISIASKREKCWRIKATANGQHRLLFYADGAPVEKELAVGDGLMRVSIERPGWVWYD